MSTQNEPADGQIDKHIKDLISDVVTVNGIPEVLSRYGFKKFHLSGKAYVMPMTKDEAVEMLVSVRRLTPEAALAVVNDEAGCVGGQSGGCHPAGGCISCELVNDGGRWMCICTK